MTAPLPADSLIDPSPLRVGVVGLGYAGTTHLESYAAIAGVEVVALAGKEPDRLEKLRRDYGVQHAFADWEDLVALPEVDVVSVATPNALHHPVGIAALRSGKHVLCEKPLAIDATQAREMVRAAHASDRVLEVVFNRRRRADIRWVKSFLDTEGIGPIYHVRASWKRRAGIPGLTSWFTSRASAGGGALIDLGPHVIDTVLYLLGETRATAVSAVTHGELGRAGYGAMDRLGQMAGTGVFEVEDLASALLRMEDGSSVALEISWAGHTVDDEDVSIELLGVEGGIRLYVPRRAKDAALTIFRDQAGRAETIDVDIEVPGGEHPLVIREFVDVIRSGDWTSHHGDLALHRTEIIDACYRSAREGREVRL